jgi:hypothetical protein
MEYLNLPAWVLDSPEFVGADQVERGTWLCLLRFCIGQENSGVIGECAKWKDRQWQQLCRVTLREVRRKSRLFRWEEESLRVFYYPQEAEDVVKAKRLVAQANGKLGGRPSRNPAETEKKPTLVISEKAKGNEKEGNEILSPQPPFQGGETGSVDELIRKILGLRKEWRAVPGLSAKENRVFRKNQGLLAMFPEESWEVIREFLGASLSEGDAYFQPLKLIKFLEEPGGVMARAMAWKAKQRSPRFEVVTKAGPLERTAEDAEAMAQFLKPRRVNS